MPPRVTRPRTRQSLAIGETNGDDTNIVATSSRTRGTKRIASEINNDQESQSSPEPKSVRTSRSNGTKSKTSTRGRTSRAKEQVSAEIEGETNGELGPEDTEPTGLSVKTTVKKEETKEEKEEIREEHETPTKTTTQKTKKRQTKRTTEEELVEMKPLAPRTQGLRMYIGAHVSAAKGVYSQFCFVQFMHRRELHVHTLKSRNVP